MATRSPWGGSLTQKIKPNKPKNIGQAAANKALAIEALDKAFCLSITYDGLYRVVEVHTVGTTTAFRQAMSAWQVGGQSNTSAIPVWRLFCFDECFDVKLTNIPSEAPCSEYKKGAKQFRKIDREI
ncbi:hypothetical protein F4V91_21815 [Neorhizobium galegae]|uniref:Uncharacterized protein n=1 Tax=Neorhizobium galegae TaxID=399 RepID=A0A6A1TVR6_NEOGA|nr:hypothetical protein [Neorhizobium galegae]KAB1088783.1 hypothetical protein F4V91_21815 [Neorhizobium galegae]